MKWYELSQSFGYYVVSDPSYPHQHAPNTGVNYPECLTGKRTPFHRDRIMEEESIN